MVLVEVPPTDKFVDPTLLSEACQIEISLLGVLEWQGPVSTLHLLVWGNA